MTWVFGWVSGLGFDRVWGYGFGFGLGGLGFWVDVLVEFAWVAWSAGRGYLNSGGWFSVCSLGRHPFVALFVSTFLRSLPHVFGWLLSLLRCVMCLNMAFID